jgi:hypothetical protein
VRPNLQLTQSLDIRHGSTVLILPTTLLEVRRITMCHSSVGYVLPAVIFSMTIPRPSKVEVPDFCFALKLSYCDAIYKVPLSLLLASLFIIVDTTLWVICIFAMVGPMIFSGILEGVIDYVVVTRLVPKDEASRLTLRLSRSGRKTYSFQSCREIWS